LPELLEAQVWLGCPSWFFVDRIGGMSVFTIVYSRPVAASLPTELATLARPSSLVTRHLVQVRVDTRWLSIHFLVRMPDRGLRVDFPGEEDDANEVIVVVDGEETVEESLRTDFGGSLDHDELQRTNAYEISIYSVRIPLPRPSDSEMTVKSRET
jgi:hypothetical protein